MPPESITKLSSIAGRYDGFLLDLWGVIHDGSALYPHALLTLESLKAAGKRVVFVSNAPRRISKVVAVLSQLGVTEDLYEGVISSGETAFRALESGEFNFGENYLFIGPERDACVMNGLPYKPVLDPKDADFIVNAGFGTEEQAVEDFIPILDVCIAHQLPMLCLNPDMEVVKISGERYPCAGVIAKAYARLGGEVHWFGKPYPAIYAACAKMLAPLEKHRILAVGDGLYTDILGANRAGIESVLVTGGILQGKVELEKGAPQPDFIIPEFK